MERTSDEDRERIHKLSEQGLSLRAIGRHVGRDHKTVASVLNPAVAERKRETDRAWRAANIERCRENEAKWDAANPTKVAMQSAKKRAKQYGVPFEGAIEQELGEYPTHCPVCHVEMVSHIGEGRMQSDSPSVDRLVPAIGYVPGNVSWMCQGCNAAKKDGTMEDLRARRDRLTLAS
jgi:hypothetical protein